MEKKILLCLLIFVCFVGNSFAEDEIDFIKKFSPNLKIEHVIEVAKAYAKNEKIDLKDYFIKKIEYDWQKKEWYIFFQGRVPNPGNCFMIFIDDKTKEIRLQPGL